MIRTSRRQLVERTGFTMIELLVVMAIIALLTALTAGAVMRYLTTQKQNVTETTIAKIDSELKKHWQKVIDDAQKDPLPAGLDSFYNTSDTGILRVIYVKLKLKQQFPMSFGEALNPLPLQPEPAYVQYLTQYSAPGSNPPMAYESSACLLMALQRVRGGMSLSIDMIGSDQIKTTPTGLPYLSDGWEQPLAFYRWPTANNEVNQLNKAKTPPSSIKRDSQDPDGKLFDATWIATTTPVNGRQNFKDTVHALSDALPSQYLIPVIVSCGPNKKLGIFPPVGAGNPDPMADDGSGASNDNIYSFRLTLGGKGD